jgi:hypothetical protein
MHFFLQYNLALSSGMNNEDKFDQSEMHGSFN